MPCYSYNCDDVLGDHTLNACEDEIQGGFRDIIIFECNHQLSPSDVSNGTAVNAEIEAGRATLIKNVKVGSSAPSPTTVSSNIANTPDKVVKYTKEFTLVDGNVNSDNMSFYNLLGSGRSFGAIMLHNADEQIVLFYNSDLRGSGGLVEPDNDGEYMRFEYSFTLDSKKDAANPVFATEPSGVFD